MSVLQSETISTEYSLDPLHGAGERSDADVTHLSRAKFDDYFTAREQMVEAGTTEDPERLAPIQSSVAEWLEAKDVIPTKDGYTAEQYAAVDNLEVTDRFVRLANFLRMKHPGEVAEQDLSITEKFLNSTFSMYEDGLLAGPAHDADGSFAFVVPARMSRENTEYGQEVEDVIPIMKYVPRNLRASLMVGLPPFVIDRYNVDADGRRGYLIFAPIYPDMFTDLGLGGSVKVGRQKVDEAVDFAYNRLGTKVVGLGATIPMVTKFGQSISNPDVITTTGHGGTVQLILDTVRRAQQEGRIADQDIASIGVLGVGSIGASIASVVSEAYPDAHTSIFDDDEGKLKKVHDNTGLAIARNTRTLLQENDVIISAITGKIDLDSLGLLPNALEGKVIVDDSQPACFDPEQVAKYGGTVAWVVGHNGDTIVRGSYSYGETMADAKNDLFGCEAEAATLSAQYQDYLKQGMSPAEADAATRRIAIREAVNPERVRNIANLFVKYSVSAAPLQAFGKLI